MTDASHYDDSALNPVKVTYCAKCGMPPEYCEYGPDYESHCIPWLQAKHRDLFLKLQSTRTTKPKTEGAATDNDAGGADGEQGERPIAPWTTEERLTHFYELYQPDKVSDVPGLLEKYAGKEDKLFAALVKKYGAEPDDPYYFSDDDDDSEGDEQGDEEGLEGDMQNLTVAAGKKGRRRGAKAKKAESVETRVVIQKIARKKKKATTVIVGMETVPGIKLKDVSKAFSKQFAGSSSVKDGATPGTKEIILQGDHMEAVADMIVSKFKVPGNCVWLDMNGDFVCFA